MNAILSLAIVSFYVGSLAAQKPGTLAGGGAGPVSPSVVATWNGYGSPVSGGVTVELLVLWRGKPRWPERLDVSEIGAGGTDHAHTLKRQGAEFLTLFFDPKTRQVQLQGEIVPLGNGNVVLIDDVDVPGRARIVQVLRVENSPGGAGPARDPAASFVATSRSLFDFIRCAPEFMDPRDPEREQRLAACRALPFEIEITKAVPHVSPLARSQQRAMMSAMRRDLSASAVNCPRRVCGRLNSPAEATARRRCRGVPGRTSPARTP